MPRPFVAVDLPSTATAELAAIRPPAAPGIRLVESGQMHLTLHFLGEADLDRTAAALRPVVALAFPLVIEGVGQFPSTGGAVTLWAGVRESPELLGLRAAVAAALAGEGFRPEVRPYTPHVTLARCGAEIPAGAVDEFLARRRTFSLPGVPVLEFGLYSSAFVGDLPVYQRERSFLLSVPEVGAPARPER
jgi:2'-5' RNA ligase